MHEGLSHTVGIVGMGSAGLSLALTLNERGIRVTGVDTSPDVLVKLRLKNPPFPGKRIERLVHKHVGNLLTLKQHFETQESSTYIICSGPPVDERGNVLMSPFEAAVSEVGRVLKRGDLVMIRSTVPIGTCRSTVIPVLERLSSLSAQSDFFIACAPERTVEENTQVSPQVIGGINEQSTDAAARLVRTFTRTVTTVDSLEEAEALAVLEGAFRDVNLGFSNEVVQIFDGLGLSARRVIRAMNEGNVCNAIPYPSPCACPAPELYFLVQSARNVHRDAKLPLVARAINESMVDFIVRKVDTFIERTGKDPASVQIFLMGLAPHSTAVEILTKLKHTYEHIAIYDPTLRREDLQTFGCRIAPAPEQGFHSADCVLVLEDDSSFADLDIASLAGTMRRPGLLFDPWGVYNPEQLSALEEIYYAGL